MRDAVNRRPGLPARALRAADRVAAWLGIKGPSLDPACLIAAARQQTGLHSFGSNPPGEGLDVLAASLDREADLALFGRFAAAWDLTRLLSTRLVLAAEEAAAPEIRDRPIEAPIFIAGLPRSGTSFLHALLAQDPANSAPLCWQTIYPYPGHRALGRKAGPARVARQFRAFTRLEPELPSLHPFDAFSPQECTEITAHTFASLRFDSTYDIPSYRGWLDRHGHLAAFQFHRRFLQHLAHRQGDRRWVLKSPDHVFTLDAIRAVYPDARLVFVHRDPLKVLPSVARLTEILRRPFARHVDRLRIGQQIRRDWSLGMRRIIEASAPGVWPPGQIWHVHYRTLVADPLATVATLYRHFGLPLTAEAEAAMRRMVTSRPNGGYGRNVYRFEQYGIDPAQERLQHRDYMVRFNVEAEVPDEPRSSRGTASPAGQTVLGTGLPA
jgi:hypothetical protein